ncbi:MAG: 1-acyl-sn-glycerol-3-phosphate acyltransferase [Alphaproteobacteria bacterium TMED194]|nr:MAG: 1-acyl-sn-glycerol-3-phosphate acyltransferase [Alphaproteobacteria bacterium TMED194]
MFLRVFFFNIIFYFSILFFGLLLLPILTSRTLTRKTVRVWAKCIILVLTKILNIKIVFKNNSLKEKEGQVIAANHQSAFDTIFFLAAFDKTIYIIKKELIFIPVYGWYAMRLGNIYIDRKKKIESIKKISKNIVNLIKQDYKIVIFPEGTRQAPKKIGAIKPGVFLIQDRLKRPIFPVYIDSGETWPRNSFKIKKKNIFIKSLKPIPYGLTKKKFKEILKKSFRKNL